LHEYKLLVRSLVYLALVQIIAAFTTFLLGTILVLITTLSFAIFIGCANGVIFSLHREITRLEQKARSLPVVDGELARQYRKISKIWQKRLFFGF
jgi:hypothetical protein